MNRISSIQVCLISITICCLFFFFIRAPRLCPINDQVCQVQKGFTITMAFVWSNTNHQILKFSTTFYMTTLNTYTGEVYPTSVRTNGYGVCMTFGQIGITFHMIQIDYRQQSRAYVYSIYDPKQDGSEPTHKCLNNQHICSPPNQVSMHILLQIPP